MKRLYHICLTAIALVLCAQGAWSQLASSTWPKFHRDYAANGVGMVSEIGASDGITVDTTPPGIVKVTDTGAYTSDNTQLRVTFECNDPESGISGYECAVGTLPGGSDVSNWQNVGPDSETVITGLQLQDGVIYYISARAINGAGMPGLLGRRMESRSMPVHQ